ncbi:DNA-3-methyladenine glycosylase I [Chloroflexota bacterium]
MNDNLIRCAWAGEEPLYRAYHDQEWGQPVHDERELFEFILLEGAQAGLSWSTILNKRENYRKAFDNFDPHKVAAYDEDKIQQLLENHGIVRNKLKVRSAVSNAQAFLEVQAEFGNFDHYIWGFVDHKPVINQWKTMYEIPAETETSRKLSKDLKARGFKFVGPTICYALMQAIGMVNDHMVDCFRYPQLGG